MGTYYRVINYDEKEYISLSSIANIKYGAYTSWSYQIAILTVFLGSNYYRDLNIPEQWIGLWIKDRISIENDSTDNESDEWHEELTDLEYERKDMGMMFLSDLRKKGELLDRWLKAVDQTLDEWQLKQLDLWVMKYDPIKDNPEEKGT